MQPDAQVFVNLIKACTRASDYVEGKKLHCQLVQTGFASITYVCHAVIKMYGKFGFIEDAENVFCDMANGNVVSWNVMLSAYVDSGNRKKALLLYRQMQEESVLLSGRTFVSVLQACCIELETLAKKRNCPEHAVLDILQAVHSFAWKKGFSADVFLRCTLVSMYGKQGCLRQAESVALEVSLHNVVAWNALLSAYVSAGKARMALQVYKQMSMEGVSPNERTLVVLLQAFCSEGITIEEELPHNVFLEIVQALHIDARMYGFISDVFIGSCFIKLYGKFGTTKQAAKTFDDLSCPNVFSWNAMLAVYIEQNKARDCLCLFRQMEVQGIEPDERSFALAVKACLTGAGDMEIRTPEIYLDIGQALHAMARRKGFALDIRVGSSLISMYSRFKHLRNAVHVFVGFSDHAILPWSAILSAFIELNEGEKALQLYIKLKEEAALLDAQTFVSTIQACILLAMKEKCALLKGSEIRMVTLKLARAIHADAKTEGFLSNAKVASALITLYSRCGSINEAELVFSGFPRHTVVTFNSMLSALLLQGQGLHALQLYEEMLKEHVMLDEVTLMCVLQASTATGHMLICKECHFAMVCASLNVFPMFGNVLVHSYAMCMCILDAGAVLNELLQTDTMSWSALIDGYARHGFQLECFQAFEELLSMGIFPDATTFLLLVMACNHGGLLSEGSDYFVTMIVDHGVSPDTKHYASLLDLFGRAGCLSKVKHALGSFPIDSNRAAWMGLLGSCQTHGNVELAKELCSEAVQFWPDENRAYIVMSNIWEDVGQGECLQLSSSPKNVLSCFMELIHKGKFTIYVGGPLLQTSGTPSN